MVARTADRGVPRYSLIRGVFFTSKELFPNAALKKLIFPLVIEQVLAITVGLADTMMVSSVGEAAVSGVSLVDMLNVLIINIFSALATGGAVVVAQLLGARKNDRACDASKQLYLVVTVIALIISALVMLFRAPLLRLLFGTIEDDVMQSALTYLTVSVFSYPVLAIYNAGAALFRAQGNSRISMLIAGLINIVNLIGNSLFIFVFKWGVAGAALSSVLSRGTAAVAITILLLNPEHTVSLRRGQRFRPDKELIRRILQIGVPNGLENSLFQLGRVLVVSMISLFGTTQITANALANNLDAVAVIPGQAMSLAMITVIGQCIGSGAADAPHGEKADGHHLRRYRQHLPCHDCVHAAYPQDLQRVCGGACARHDADYDSQRLRDLPVADLICYAEYPACGERRAVSDGVLDYLHAGTAACRGIYSRGALRHGRNRHLDCHDR